MPKAILDHGPAGSDFPAQTEILWDRGGNGIALGVVVPDPVLLGTVAAGDEYDPRHYLQDPRNAPSVGWYHTYNAAQLDQLLDTLHHVRRELNKPAAGGVDPNPDQDAPSRVQDGILPCVGTRTSCQPFGDLPGDVQGEIAAELSPLDPAQGRPLVPCQDDDPHVEHPWTRGGPHGSKDRLYCRGVEGRIRPGTDLGLRAAGGDPV